MNSFIVMFGFAVSLVVSVSATPAVTLISKKLKLFDVPDSGHNARRIHSTPIPRLGGISIFLGFLAPIVLFYDNDVLTSISLISISIFLLGLIDDLFNVSAVKRIVIQLTIAFITTVQLNLSIDSIILTQGIHISLPFALSYALPTLIIVGAINSLNMIDGLDGLAGGVFIVSLLMLAYLFSITTNFSDATVIIALPMIGATLGFLRYNTHPATIFMGDSGSNWLGYMIGVFILINLSSTNIFTDQPKAAPSLISAILCFAIPIFDTFLVIVSRMIKGLNPMHSDNRHFHHSLINLGLSQSQAVVCIYFLSICSAISGLLPIIYPNYSLEWAPILWSSLLITIIPLSVFLDKKNLQRLVNFKKYVVAHPTLSVGSTRLITLWERVNKYCLFSVLVLPSVFAGGFDVTIGYISTVSLALLLTMFATTTKKNDFFETVVIAICCITLLIANNHRILQVGFQGSIYHINDLYNFLFIFLAASTSMFVLFTLKRKYLILTPSDFLMALIPLLMLLSPQHIIQEYYLDIISLRCFIVFIAYKALEKRRRSSNRHLKLAFIFSLAYIASVSLLGFKIMYD